MTTVENLVIAAVGFSAFFALGVFGLVAPRRLSRLFRVVGARMYGSRMAAQLFHRKLVRFTGGVLVLTTPFVAWAAVARILDS